MLACTALNLVMKCSLLITMGLDTKYIIIIIEKSNNCMRRAQFPFHLNLGSWNYSVKIDPAQKPDPDSRLSQKKLQTNCLQSTQFILDKNLIESSLVIIGVVHEFNEGRKASHNHFSSEPHSPHFLVRANSKSSSFDFYVF